MIALLVKLRSAFVVRGRAREASTTSVHLRPSPCTQWQLVHTGWASCSAPLSPCLSALPKAPRPSSYYIGRGLHSMDERLCASGSTTESWTSDNNSRIFVKRRTMIISASSRTLQESAHWCCNKNILPQQRRAAHNLDIRVVCIASFRLPLCDTRCISCRVLN